MIVYLRVVPGLGIAVEELARPALRSRPVIMGGLPHQRGTVREASSLAQRCGVRPGMTLAQAHQQCPEGVFLVPDEARYQAVWGVLCEIVQGYTELVEPVEMGQLVCDLSGCEQLWGGSARAARQMVSQVRQETGIVSQLGVASNRLVAQLASAAVDPGGVTVVEEGQERAFLSGLPITLLPDVDSHLALTFHVLGLKTIGQLAALPLSAVKQRFGALGQTLHRYARGVDSRPVQPPPGKPSVAARYECDGGGVEEAVEGIHHLADLCAEELQARGLAGRLVALTLVWEPVAHLLPLPADVVPPAHEALLPDSNTPHGPELTAQGSQLIEGFPIPYRIHSMLPQPGMRSAARSRRSQEVPSLSSRDEPALPAHPGSSAVDRVERASKLKVAVRTPINTAAPLVEQGQRLLLRSWPREGERNLQAIELEVSEFEAPFQLAFDEWRRLDQTGTLGGCAPGRLQALAEQEQVLVARYGREPFRHLGAVNLESVLTERRFQWEDGLPWASAPPVSPARSRGRSRRP